MLGFSKPASATASSGGDATPASAISSTDLKREKLAALEDEEYWQTAHFKHVLAYNMASPAFWMLMLASMCFAMLNAVHGFNSSGGVGVGFAAGIIGILYFVIEFMVPVAAHLMSWGSHGVARWAVRPIGLLAFMLAVSFSLTILQSKFAGGADSATARAKVSGQLLESASDGLDESRKAVKDLRKRVGTGSEESYGAEIAALLGQSITKKETLNDTTAGCTEARARPKERELCAEVDRLRRLKSDAKSLADHESKIGNLTGTLGKVDMNNAVGDAFAADKVLGDLMGWDFKKIATMKATMIALIAAIITHLLWAAHGFTVNTSIAGKRNHIMESRSLKRAIDRDDVYAKRAVSETQANFLAASGAPQRIAMAIATSTLVDQPVVVQVQQFFNERTIMGPDYAQSISHIYDAYMVWCHHNNITPVLLDKFSATVKAIGLLISAHGQVVGAAVK